MTREHKLALIVGFSLVLILGVLVSDHLSPARNKDSATASALAVTAREVGAGNPLAQSGGSGGNWNGSVPSRLPSNPPQRVPIDSTSGTTSSTMAGAGGPMASGGLTPMPPLPGSTGQPTFQPIGQPQGTPVAAVQMSTSRTGNIPVSNTPIASVTSFPIPGPGTPAGMSGETRLSGETGLPGELGGTRIPAGAGLPISRESVKRHDVRDGDSMYRLASQMYGDGNLWTKIRDYPANAGKIGSNGTMREGVTLILPPKDVLLGKAVLPSVGTTGNDPGTASAMARDDRRTEVKPEVKPDAKPEVKGTTYVVQSGDTLADISRRKLGSARRSQEIIDLNRLEDADHLKIGMTLKLPTR